MGPPTQPDMLLKTTQNTTWFVELERNSETHSFDNTPPWSTDEDH